MSIWKKIILTFYPMEFSQYTTSALFGYVILNSGPQSQFQCTVKIPMLQLTRVILFVPTSFLRWHHVWSWRYIKVRQFLKCFNCICIYWIHFYSVTLMPWLSYITYAKFVDYSISHTNFVESGIPFQTARMQVSFGTFSISHIEGWDVSPNKWDYFNAKAAD